MYIKCKDFNEWLNYAINIDGISPGGVAKSYNVSRQAVNNWINNDVIDAYFYEGKEGQYTIIDIEDFKKIDKFREKR
jgi:hypothetical protein